MSITDHKPAKPKSAGGAHLKAASKPGFRRPVVLAAACGVVAALVVAGAVWDAQRSSVPATVMPARTAPLTLPGTINNLAAAPRSSDFASQPIWQSRARSAAPGATVVGRSYGSAALRRQIRVVAGRANLTGKLEFAWAADAGRTVDSPLGSAHCTQDLRLAPGTAPAVRPTVLLCWRTTAALSAYSVIIDFDHHPMDAAGLAALDAVWKAALTGR